MVSWNSEVHTIRTIGMGYEETTEIKRPQYCSVKSYNLHFEYGAFSQENNCCQKFFHSLRQAASYLERTFNLLFSQFIHWFRTYTCGLSLPSDHDDLSDSWSCCCHHTKVGDPCNHKQSKSQSEEIFQDEIHFSFSEKALCRNNLRMASDESVMVVASFVMLTVLWSVGYFDSEGNPMR